MSALQVTALVLVLLLLLAQIRIGVVAAYARTELTLRLRIGPLRIQLLPAKSGGNGKRAKKAKESTAKPGEQRVKISLWDLIPEFLPLALDTVKKFRRRLQTDTLTVELTVATPDPADTALQYGKANALLASLWGPVVQTFHVQDGRAHLGMDFDAVSPTLYLLASLSLTIGQAVVLSVVFGVKALGILMRTRSKKKNEQQLKQRKAVDYGTQPSDQ